MAVVIPPPGPNPVEKDENEKEMKFVVEIKDDVSDAEEIYPIEPRPVTVDKRVAELRNPAV